MAPAIRSIEAPKAAIRRFAHLVRTGEVDEPLGEMRLGIDLGTANIVVSVVDAGNRPHRSHVTRRVAATADSRRRVLPSCVAPDESRASNALSVNAVMRSSIRATAPAIPRAGAR